jgi:hypothetical protein
MNLIDVTSHPLATADLQIRDPRKPLPPATTSRFLTPDAIAGAVMEAALDARKGWEPNLPHQSATSFGTRLDYPLMTCSTDFLEY